MIEKERVKKFVKLYPTKGVTISNQDAIQYESHIVSIHFIPNVTCSHDEAKALKVFTALALLACNICIYKNYTSYSFRYQYVTVTWFNDFPGAGLLYLPTQLQGDVRRIGGY